MLAQINAVRSAGRRTRQASGLLHPEFVARALSTVIAMVLWIGSAAFANEAVPVRVSETVIVPYDATKPVAGQKPDQFYLPYERFLELWEAAKKSRTGVEAEPSAVAYVLSAARYDGVVGERSVAITGKLDVTTYNDAWVKVPLAFRGVQIGSLKIDGVAAAYDGAEIIVEKPGRHTVEVAFEIPLRRGATAFAWGVPRTGATLVALTLPDARTRAVIAPGGGVIERTVDGAKVITAAVGTTDGVEVKLEGGDEATRVAEPAVANFGPWVTVMPTLETSGAAYTFTFPKARQDRFTVYFENGLTLTAIEAVNVKSWKLTAGADRQSLEIVLNEAAREEYSFSIHCERPMPKLPAEMHAPVFSAAAKRLESGVALFAGKGVEVTAQPAATLRQTPMQLPAETPGRLIGGYNGTGLLGYRAALSEPRREARVDYAYQVNRRKIELIASLQLFAKGDDVLAMTVALPAQFDVQAVQSERLQDWWREGDTLHLRFSGTTPEMTPLVVYLVRQYAAAPTEIDVRPLTLDGFKKVNGEAVIAAHKGVEVKMKLSDEGKEVAPERAATDFQILPPLERKRGFTFADQKFAAQVVLAALPAKTNALWVLHALAHEGWVGVSVHAQLMLRQGSIDRATFTLPAVVPEARVSGGEVRETRSRVEGDRRVYEVQFQNDVYEAVEFTVDLELPNPGEVAMPAIAFRDAQMTSGFVLTDNASEFEMKLTETGTDPVPVSEIPFLPELSKNAGIYRVQPGWSVKVGVERLEKAATRAAFVAWAEMTTALRRDGTEWHRATYRLQNRSLQFLPVKLPAGAELMSVRVAGQSVRADAGKVNGAEAILVPLIKTKPGDLSYDVELVYRLQRAELGWRTTRDFRDPELPGITVERTLWNVWLPDDRRLSKADGNMEAVLGDLNKVEKIESKRQEQKALFSILNSTKTSAATKQNAKYNWGVLQKEIAAENRDENFAETNSYFRRSGAQTPKPTPAEESVGKKGIAQQGDYVANKRRALNDEVEREAQKLEELEKSAPMNAPMNTQLGTSPLTGANRSGGTAISANAIDALLFGAAGAPSGNTAQRGEQITDQIQQFIANAPAADVQGSRAAQQGQNWTANGGFISLKPAATPAPANAEGLGNNLYLNDNIVLQQRVVVEKPKGGSSPAKPQAGGKGGGGDISGSDFANKLPQAKDAQNDLSDLSQQMKQADKAEGKGEKVQTENFFNTARGNSVRFQEQQAQMQQQMPSQMAEQPATRQPMPQADLPAAAAVPARPQGLGNGFNPAPAAASVSGNLQIATGTLTFGGGMGQGRGAEDEARRLQTAGRISLAVDFPTEGQVLHFKKVKANARLELTTSTPETWVRWQYLGAALALAGVLLVIQRLAEGRGRAPRSSAARQ